MSSYTLYGTFLSMPCVKAGLMLDLCGLPYDYKHVNLRAGESKTPDFLKLNKWGQVPVLVANGTPMTQSGAILLELAAKTGKFDGADPEEKRQVREWLFWEADLMYPGIAATRAQRLFYNGPAEVIAFFKGRGERALGMLNEALTGKDYLVGAKPTVADIACYVTAAYAGDAELSLDAYPAIQAWMKRMTALPGMKVPQEALPKPAA